MAKKTSKKKSNKKKSSTAKFVTIRTTVEEVKQYKKWKSGK